MNLRYSSYARYMQPLDKKRSEIVIANYVFANCTDTMLLDIQIQS